jgi:hypothetical protein
LQLAVASQDAPWAIRFLEMARAEAEAQDDTVAVDLDAESTACPACMTEFAPSALAENQGRCPGCGLVLAAG